MAMRKISLVVNEFYHIYNRGVEKRVIFIDKYDYQRFVELLFLVNTHHAIDLRSIHDEIGSVYDFDRGEPLLAIGAYCLMPNHFHLLVTPIAEDGVSLFMSKLCTSYSMYFNKKYQRNGALFQGRYKAEWADSDQYLKYLFAYIHLNPVKLIDSTWKEEGIKDAAKAYAFAASFQYSSLSDYLSLRLKTRDVLSMRSEAKILNSTKFPNYFQTLAKGLPRRVLGKTYVSSIHEPSGSNGVLIKVYTLIYDYKIHWYQRLSSKHGRIRKTGSC